MSANSLLAYSGKNVVITGAASGMGAATAKLLQQQGANVYALDIADISFPVTSAVAVDMQDFGSIDNALSQLPDTVDCLFNCAGVPSPPFGSLQTLLINFCGLRHLTDALLPRMSGGAAIVSIASTAGMGWRASLQQVNEFLALDNQPDTVSQWWDKYGEGKLDPYGFSKQCLIVYTQQSAKALAEREVRINCIAPSPTDSAFMEKLKGEGQIPDDAVALFLPSNGRYASGEDMAGPLLALNSPLMGFVSGQNLPVDFGYCAEVLMQQRDDLLGIS